MCVKVEIKKVKLEVIFEKLVWLMLIRVVVFVLFSVMLKVGKII